MISEELRAEIRRKFFAEHWKIGTIASTLGLHHMTVRSAVEGRAKARLRGELHSRELEYETMSSGTQPCAGRKYTTVTVVSEKPPQ